MPISHKNKIVFVHIPKNAGTSIITSKELSFDVIEHRCALSYKINNPDYWQEYTTVAIVRNPWDRFVSCYEYARMKNSYWHSNDKQEKSAFGPHEDFNIASNLNFTDFTIKFITKQLTLSHPGWTSQHRWVCGDNFKIIVDKIFRFEEIETNLEFKKIFGNIKKLNKSLRSNYKDYYNEETREIIREVYKKDIEIFNYSF
jgi:hypothetical protein